MSKDFAQVFAELQGQTRAARSTGDPLSAVELKGVRMADTVLARGPGWILEQLPDGQYRLSFLTGGHQERELTPIITPDEARSILDDPQQFEQISRRYVPWIDL